MTALSTRDLAHVLLALAALLLAAHLGGSLFARLRQPRAIGEIVGGLALGPTLLGAVAPAARDWLFPVAGPTPIVIGAVYHLGLLLLLFIAGTELRTVFARGERRTVGAVFVLGTVLPLIVGLVTSQLINQQQFWGPQANTVSFVLVFSIAMAVTSIPVISRIMHDLGILHTGFARIVLGVAVLEDLVLYVVLAVAIGYGGAGDMFGLPAALGIAAGTPADMLYHIGATTLFLGTLLAAGPTAYRKIGALEINLIQRATPVAHQLAFMLLTTAAGLLLGVEAFFGAFLSGLIVAATEREPSEATLAIRSFSLAFFIPIYFATIGLGLDLINSFDLAFFVGFLLIACVAKAASVYAGARFAGEQHSFSLNLAVAMNARGGPGIVVASTAFTAGVINRDFYAVLVLLAVVTSLVAGAWLERVKPGALAGPRTAPIPAAAEAPPS